MSIVATEKETRLSESDADIVADVCSVQGCEEPQDTRDLCMRHYNEWLGSREAPEEESRNTSLLVLGYPTEISRKPIWAG